MKKKNNLSLILIVLLLASACRKSNETTSPEVKSEPSYIGYWKMDSIEQKNEVDTPEYYYIRQVFTVLNEDYHMEVLNDSILNWSYGTDQYDSIQYGYKENEFYIYGLGQVYYIGNHDDLNLTLLKVTPTSNGRNYQIFYMTRD